MKVSVVIPCYNLGDFLLEAIDSVRAQTYTDWELIVVDDGSTDSRTIRVLDQVQTQSTDITVIRKKNGGLSSARNTGIEKSKGDYIVCLDADDVLTPTYLEKTVAIMEKDTNKKVGFVTTWLQEFGARTDIWKAGDYDEVKLLAINQAHAGSLFRKDVWKKVGGYKVGKTIDGYEDWDLWLSIVEAGYIWKTIPEPLFKYRIRPNSMLSVNRDKHAKHYATIVSLHQALFTKHFDEMVYETAASTAELHAAIKEKNTAISVYKAEIEQQKQLLAASEEKYESLYRSRIMLMAQRLIDLSISLRRIIGLRHRIIGRLKRLFPRRLLGLTRKVKNAIWPIEVVEVVNEAWQGPLVTVVTPYYNQSHSVQETINSVLAQTFQNIEYILVNDGSDEDNTAALNVVVDPKIQIIHHKKNIGQGSPAAARNSGIEKAKGKYIVCLDADDALDPTYIEKAVAIMEADPAVSLVGSDTQTFGASESIMTYQDYDPRHLLTNNMVITAAMYRRSAWQEVGGYKTGIGYEDWEFTINLAEHGYFGRRIPERLFRYRMATESRYIEDRKKHDANLLAISGHHPDFTAKVNSILRANKRKKLVVTPDSMFTNLSSPANFKTNYEGKNVLIAIPWMTFGGAETLIINFCEELKHSFNLSFVTGLESEHEWEHKFRDITPNIFHLANLFDTDEKYLEFLSHYITSRKIDLIHVIHTHFIFKYLPELKRRHPELKVTVTLFNDRAHFTESVEVQEHIDSFTSDNSKVIDHFKRVISGDKLFKVIPNGINCSDIYNPANFDRQSERATLGLHDDDLAVFFVGRLSPEKNPDVFIDAAKQLAEKKTQHLKFFIIGDGPMRNEVEDRIKKAGGQVKYLGYQSEVARYLSAADIFVLPSSIEGFPLSILEAMAMKVVSVASDVGAVAEVIIDGKQGFIVTPGSASEIAESIARLESDRKLLQSMKVSSRQRLEQKYSNDALGKNYTDMYNEAINS